MSPTSRSTNRRLLAVFAHPDDETFGVGGTLALYARQGVEVYLVCATRGEVGEAPADLIRESDEAEADRFLVKKEVSFSGLSRPSALDTFLRGLAHGKAYKQVTDALLADGEIIEVKVEGGALRPRQRFQAVARFERRARAEGVGPLGDNHV